MKNSLNILALGLVLSFSQITFAQQMYGIFMVVKGTVKIQNASKQVSDAKVGAKIFEGDMVTTLTDARAKIVMSDRNVINVNPDTQLQITKYQNDTASGKKNVELNLLNGKVRNNVEQTYDGDKSKFLIKTPTAVAGVRGTQFMAGFDKKTQMTSIVTFKGAVSLATISASGQILGAPVMVNKGEMTVVTPNQPPPPPKPVPQEEIKKMDGETSVSLQNRNDSPSTKDMAAKESASKDVAAGKDSTAPSSGQKRDVASDVNAPMPPPPGATAPSMIDKKDMDINMAKDIKDVRAVAPPPVMPPRAPTATTDNSIVKDILKDTFGKTKVIIKPQPQ